MYLMLLSSPTITFGALLLAASARATRTTNGAQRRQTSARGLQLPVHRVPRIRPSLPISLLSTDVPITNHQEFAYLIPVTIGGQVFPVILDTGSSDLWVVSSDCITSDCDGVQKYSNAHSTSSSLSETPFKLSYLMGSVTGKVGFDTVAVDRFEISSQVFAVANETKGLGLTHTGNSGILGLSFPSIAAISLSLGQTLLENLFANFDEPDRFFAFKLGRDLGADDSGSSFTIGQLDPTIVSDMSEFSFTPVSQRGANMFNYWKLPLRSLTLNSTVFPIAPSLVPGVREPIAVLDTGTTLVLGPTSDVEAFWGAVGQEGAARKNADTGMWEVRCDRGISVGFILGEKGHEREYTVDPGDISWAEGGSAKGWCMGGIQANDGVNSGDWLLGDVFLRNVYVTHHVANSTHPPLIGLLSLTDPSNSMVEFRKSRGPDSSPPSTARIHQSIPTVSPPHTTAIYIVSSASGFMGGAILAIVVRVRRGRLM